MVTTLRIRLKQSYMINSMEKLHLKIHETLELQRDT